MAEGNVKEQGVASRRFEEGMVRRVVGMLAVACAVAAAVGCGAKRPTAADTAPFAAAVEGYVKANSMGMRVDGFESLKVSGDRATAEVRMADKDIGYGLRPLWKFTFEQAADGWKVVEVKRE